MPSAENDVAVAQARAEALEEAAENWPESGMTRAEAQAWLQGRASRERGRAIPPGSTEADQ